MHFVHPIYFDVDNPKRHDLHSTKYDFSNKQLKAGVFSEQASVQVSGWITGFVVYNLQNHWVGVIRASGWACCTGFISNIPRTAFYHGNFLEVKLRMFLY